MTRKIMRYNLTGPELLIIVQQELLYIRLTPSLLVKGGKLLTVKIMNVNNNLIFQLQCKEKSNILCDFSKAVLITFVESL